MVSINIGVCKIGNKYFLRIERKKIIIMEEQELSRFDRRLLNEFWLLYKYFVNIDRFLGDKLHLYHGNNIP